MTTVPMPSEAHPGLPAGLRAVALAAMAEGEWMIVYVVPARFRVDLDGDRIHPTDLPARTRSMRRRACYGPAPYVGRPFAYRWDAMIDDLGRAVATPAWLEYTDGRRALIDPI